MVGEDKLIYVADTGNCRISIFNQQGLYLSNIPLLKPKQRPILLRSYWQDLYCLTDDALILWIPLSGEKIVQQQISAASISSFDILPSGRIALVDGKAQKLRIYNGKVKEYEYFSQSSKAEFPHFKSIYLIRYDEVNQQLVIMDKAVKKTRVLKFYAALNTKQSIILDLNESLQTVLSWAAEPGIDHWTIQARMRRARLLLTPLSPDTSWKIP